MPLAGRADQCRKRLGGMQMSEWNRGSPVEGKPSRWPRTRLGNQSNESFLARSSTSLRWSATC